MRRNPTAGIRDPNAGRAGTHAHAEAGFSAVTAIVILVILAVLGAAIVTITGTRSTSAALDVLGSRAYQAARAGIEWGAFQIRNPENTNNPVRYDCTVPATTHFALAGTLTGFTVSVTCSSTDATEFGNAVRIFQLVANACNIPVGAAPGTCPNTVTNFNYVERQVTAVLETCRLSNGEVC